MEGQSDYADTGGVRAETTHIASPLVRLSTALYVQRGKIMSRKSSGHSTIPIKVPVVKEVRPGILLD
jgi:hypothetical protein